jgi:thiamine biosynthesis lipoprotein
MTNATHPLQAQRTGISEARFGAMGGGAHVLVVGGPPSLVSRARERIGELERSWSRFIVDSDLNRLNASSGGAVGVSPDLFRAVCKAVEAWELTGGLFDPTILETLRAAGYDRSFELVGASDDTPVPVAGRGCADIELDTDERCVYLPSGCSLDLGGIGKGLAADIVVTELFRLGAEGALVNIGGDVRVAGTSPYPGGWIIEIEDPSRPDERGVCVALADGAVATSSTLEKRWVRAGHVQHHLIDPRTGRSIATDIETATVIAAEGWWAEALTKAVFMLGIDEGLGLLERHGVHGLVFLDDGRSVGAGRWKDILA